MSNASPKDPKKPTTPPAGAPKKPETGKPAAPAAKGTTAKPTAPTAKPAAATTAKPTPKPAARERDWSEGGGRRKIGQILVDLGFIDESQLWDILEESRTNGVRVGQVALNRGLVTEEQLLQAVAELHGMRLVNLEEEKPTPQAIQMVQQTMAEVYKILPMKYENGVLTVAMADPNNLQALDDLRNFIGLGQVEAVLAPQKQLEEAITRAYTGKEESIAALIAELNADTSLQVNRRETSIDLESLTEIAEAAPVRKLINMVLLMAIRDHASDIHFEPFEDEYKMRYRCDGVLYEMVPPPRHLAMAISSRIKVMSNLDIAERRLPQDGRIELNVGGNAVDMRVSVLPTMFGESVVIRVLDRTVVSLDLNKIGMEPELLEKFRHLIHKPNGITLVTGPTGAGKTTTLYSALNELNTIEDKIITTEDPVEYEIEGIIQCPINHEIDLTFASALRAILRQDPDIILVGEIRDLETAQIAIQAALTGHMVFSTLHTNDAASTITRLRDMGVEPFLLTATIEGILAQRLVRKICTNCREEFTPSAEMLMELNLRPADVKGKKFYYGAGCEKCNNLGFRGRTGIYELILMDDNIRDMISAGASTDALRKYVRSTGVPGLREAGLKAIYNGITTIEEVVRETVLEEDA
ncbi:MAG: type II secretion system ATPase GspE [Gemmataceae bacterium]|nr:type II secretion system ATPase GspE [Gemmataceae bacterium]